MTVLRVYDPAECDPGGRPLDWEKCRTCGGEGSHVTTDHLGRPLPNPMACQDCCGHGSLKAAALAFKDDVRHMREQLDDPKIPMCFEGDPLPYLGARCEDCGHPRSEGTWEGLPEGDEAEMIVYVAAAWERVVRHGYRGEAYITEQYPGIVHYSPCDEGCRHGGPLRWDDGTPLPDTLVTAGEAGDYAADGSKPEASWRQVDVRTLGWPHDCRPEKLAVLCLRCWAARSR